MSILLFVICVCDTLRTFTHVLYKNKFPKTQIKIQRTFARLIGQSIVDLTEGLTKVKRVNYAFLIRNRARVHNYNNNTV